MDKYRAVQTKALALLDQEENQWDQRMRVLQEQKEVSRKNAL